MLVRWPVSSRRMSQRVPGLPNPVSLSCLNQRRRASLWSCNSTARVAPRAYTKHMDGWKNPIEDERGVDISQIHRQLQMSVEDRVLHMVEAANTFMEIRSHARFVDVP